MFLGVYRKVKEAGVMTGANTGAATGIWNHIFIWYVSTWIETLQNRSGKFLAHRTDSAVSVIETGPCRKYRDTVPFVSRVAKMQHCSGLVLLQLLEIYVKYSDSVILFFGICIKEIIIYTCVYMYIYGTHMCIRYLHCSIIYNR